MPITILELAKHRLGLGDDVNSIHGGQFNDAGLAIMGGCEVCHATLGAYNGCPAKTGYWRCRNGCIGDEGWETVEEANTAIFGLAG